MKTLSITFAKNQQGATLIVVLMVLLLIMVAGAMAVRQSRVDLQVATGDQINTVLLQTADNANQKLEAIINGDTNAQDYIDIMDDNGGLFGYFYNRPERAGDEFIYCQTAGTKEYLATKSTVVIGTGGELYSEGYCSKGNSMTYTSGRNVLVGQVSVTPTPVGSVNAPALSHMNIGQDINGPTVKKMQFDVRSTAAIPAYTRSSTDSVARCFGNSSISRTGSQTVSECLEALGVPQIMVYQQANVSQVTEVEMCVDFGKAEYKADSQKCVLGTPEGTSDATSNSADDTTPPSTTNP